MRSNIESGINSGLRPEGNSGAPRETPVNHWNWDSVPAEDLGGGMARQMIVGERLMVCRLRIAPRVVTPPHLHPHEQITLVERGSARFIIGNAGGDEGGGEERIAQAGDVLHFPPGCWHGATMLDEEVVLIDIFTPLREDFLK
jgi:quercetin dioxygenase-like cupin family protein